MKCTIISAFLLSAIGIFTSCIAQELPSYQENMAAAGAAFQAEDWPALSDSLDAAQLIRPYSLFVMKNRVLARELEGDRAGALQLVSALADRGLVIDLTGHEAFEALKGDPAFANIEKQMVKNAEPKGKSNINLTYPDTDLLPEALALDENGDRWVGSVRTGAISPLDADRAPSFYARGGVFDIELRGDLLWAAVNNQLAYEKTGEEEAFAALVAFDRETKAPRREIRLGDGDALIGDIEIGGDGTIYASDSITPRIFKIDTAAEARSTSFQNPRFANLQGIALDEDHGRLFIADYLTGLYVMNLETGEASLLRNDADAHLGGIDGLYLHEGDLIGIQNGTSPQRIVKMKLSKDGMAVRKLKVLAQALPEWNEPTHGIVDGDDFLYIATSNWPAYDRDGKLREGAELQPLRIMHVDLD